MSELYTIGYSSFSVEDFIVVLKKYSIDMLIDVRSVPYSAHFTDFNKKNISRVLHENNIFYRHYDKEFGGRQFNAEFFTDGILDFEKFAASEQFLCGVKKIETAINRGYKIALMCAEKRPEICHRCILVARKFYELGYDVKHILDAGNCINQGDVEEMLLKKYFPDYIQPVLFEMPKIEDLIRQSYAKRNLEIGYKC